MDDKKQSVRQAQDDKQSVRQAQDDKQSARQAQDKKAHEELKKVSEQKNTGKSDQENELLLKQIEEQKVIAEEFKTKYLRALADYQNFENRVANNNMQLLQTANANLLLKLLPFMDSLDKAEVFVKDQGLKIVKDQFAKVLKEAGLEELDVLHKEYDPYTAEVVDMVVGDKNNMVVEILRKGYKFHDKILRVAQVKVSRTS